MFADAQYIICVRLRYFAEDLNIDFNAYITSFQKSLLILALGSYLFYHRLSAS